MEFQRFFSCLFVILMGFLYSSQAHNFYVGGKDGWVTTPSENFNHWAEKNRFQVNDSLVFKYKKGSDSVLVVSKEDYYSCNTKNPIKILDGGDSVFKFDRSGPFFFISGKDGNCAKGQKLIVVVLAVRHKNPPSTPSPVTQPPKSSPPPAQPPSVPSPIAQPPKTQPPSSAPSPATHPPKSQTPTSSPTPSPIANPPKSSSPSPSPIANPPKTSSPSPSPIANPPKTSSPSPSPIAYPPKSSSPSPSPIAHPPKTSSPSPSPVSSPPTSMVSPAPEPAAAADSPSNSTTSDVTAPAPVPSSSPALITYSSIGFVFVSVILGSLFVGGSF
ncbi:Plastocyanin-like [Macleaya cordata]|uniref:Plastocyanin-like n=1 Tax=Macleaya cordata TaxID=56857 RepID=A0A200PQ91_MACCD|nr:Plastocyanin-like [Macleaya cordata]